MTSGPAVAPPTVRDLVTSLSRSLGSPAEARWIVAHTLGVPGTELAARLDDGAPAPVVAEVHAAADRYRAGEPLQYVLGTWSFRTLELSVDRRVLIPRPETEALVDVALGELSRQAATAPARLAAVDLGTGTGAIALSLAVEWTARHATQADLEVWATDVSADALEVFDRNLASLHAVRPDTARVASTGAEDRGSMPCRTSSPAGSTWWRRTRPTSRSPSGRRSTPRCATTSPRRALVAGPTGREAIEAILDAARTWLVPAGGVVLEIAPSQADAVTATAGTMGYGDAVVRSDLAGRPRVLVARWPGVATR